MLNRIYMKQIIITLVLLCTVVVALAQSGFKKNDDDKKKKIVPRVFFHGGLHFSNIGGGSESYFGILPGGYLGVGIHLFNLKEELSIDGGIGFSMEGSRYKNSDYMPGGNYSETENKVRLNYLRFPFTVKYGKENGFYGRAGLQPGLLVSAKDRHSGGVADVKDNYNGFDIGLLFGAGYNLKGHFGVGVGFAPGISNINKKGGPDDDKKDRNRTFSFGAFYRF
jgi:Outer membrane protein beta-barrel domain